MCDVLLLLPNDQRGECSCSIETNLTPKFYDGHSLRAAQFALVLVACASQNRLGPNERTGPRNGGW